MLQQRPGPSATNQATVVERKPENQRQPLLKLERVVKIGTKMTSTAVQQKRGLTSPAGKLQYDPAVRIVRRTDHDEKKTP